MVKKDASLEEFTNKYPEFARMYSELSPHKVSAADKRKLRALLKRLSASAAKLAVLGAALAVTVTISLTIRVHSTLVSISQNSAEVRARVLAEREEDREKTIFFRFTHADGTQIKNSFLPSADFTLVFENLEPGTKYLITYYAESSAKRTDAGGEPLEIVGRFAFTTLLADPPEDAPENVPDPPEGSNPGASTPGSVTTPGTVATPGTSAELPEESMDPVLPELSFITTSLPDAQELLGYVQPIMIRYTGVNTITFSLTGTLPAGLSLSPDGEFSGTPEKGTKGMWENLLVTATDSVSGVTAQITYSLNVGETKPLNITNRFLKETKQTYQYECQVTVDWADTSTLTYAASGLPLGLSIDAKTGLISGRTTEDTKNGAYAVAVTVTDTVSPATSTKQLELYVGLKPTPTPVPPEEPVITYYAMELGAECTINMDLTVATVVIYNFDASLSARVTGITMSGDAAGSWSGTQTIAPNGSATIYVPLSSAGGLAATATIRYVTTITDGAVTGTDSISATWPGGA